MRNKTASSGKMPMMNNTEKEQGLIPHSNKVPLAPYLCASQNEDMLPTVCQPKLSQPIPYIILQLNLPEEEPDQRRHHGSQRSLPHERSCTSTAMSGRKEVQQQNPKEQVSVSQQGKHSCKRRQHFSTSPVRRRSGQSEAQLNLPVHIPSPSATSVITSPSETLSSR